MRPQGVDTVRAYPDAVLATGVWMAEVDTRNPRRYETTVSDYPSGEEGSWSGRKRGLGFGVFRSVQPRHPQEWLASWRRRTYYRK